MFSENVSDSRIFSCERNYWKLGDGRKNRKVAVGDGPDIRTCNILFISSIRKNRPSKGHIEFDNGIQLDTARDSINGRSAYIFYYMDEIGDLWNIQEDKKKIVEWMKSSRPQDVLAAG